MCLIITISFKIRIKIRTLIVLNVLFGDVILLMLSIKLNGSYLRKGILLCYRVKSVILDFLFLFGWGNINFVIHFKTIVIRLFVLLIQFLFVKSQIFDDNLKPFFILITKLIDIFTIFHFTFKSRIKTIFYMVICPAWKIFRNFRPFIAIFLVS